MQLGGGIRDLDTIERYLDDGLSYVIIGTAAVKKPWFPARCLLGIWRPHHRGPGCQGWQGGHRWLEQAVNHEVIDLAKKFEDYGVEGVIYTDIGRDGMLSGINIEATVKLAQALTIP